MNQASVRCHILQPLEDKNYFNNTMVKVPKRLCHLHPHNCRKPHLSLYKYANIVLVLVKTTPAGNLVSAMGTLPKLENPDYYVCDLKQCYEGELQTYKEIRSYLQGYSKRKRL